MLRIPDGQGSMDRNWLKSLQVLGALLVLFAALPVDARTRRAVFDPEDLEMQKPGVLFIETTGGLLRDGQGRHEVMPDLSLDLGLTKSTELNIDGTFARISQGPNTWGGMSNAPDNIWLSLKNPLWTNRVRHSESAQTIGVQYGLKLPVARQSHGLGAQALGMFGLSATQRRLVLNIGYFVDPTTANVQAWGALSGVDYEFDLDPEGVWQITGDLSGAWYGQDHTKELALTGGVTYVWQEKIELSLLGLGGWLAGGPAVGGFINVSPRITLWH